MTEFKSHKNTAFKAVNGYVEPEKKDETVFADRIVLETSDFEGDQVTIKPRYETEVERKMDGVPVKDTVKKMYPISQLPETLKNLIFEVNDSENGLTLSATVGEAINDNGSSFFITTENIDTIDKQQDTLFDDEEETAEQFVNDQTNIGEGETV
jgi:cyclophilin family peptidyl-prolyl cis-trans isomerase